MLLRKQTSFFQTFEVTMEFNPQQVGAEAGLVLWWSQFSYATIGIRLGGAPDDSKRSHIACRRPKGQPGEFHVSFPWTRSWTTCSDANISLAQTTSSEISDSGATTRSMAGPFKLNLICEGSTYTLTFDQGQGGSHAQFSFSAEDLTVMPPVGGAFTGVMFGVYAFGRGEPVLDPADFTDIRVSTKEA